MPSRGRCTTCGSRQWHKEPASGLIACSEGHVLQDYRNEATDADEFGPHTLRKRTLKSGRKKQERDSKANPQLYHGARGRIIYFECLQYLLQKQIAVLAGEWKLPREFEIVCKDIWAIHLTLLPNPPLVEDDLAGDDTETIDLDREGNHTNPSIIQEGQKQQLSDEGESEVEEDEELEALLRENSELEKSSEEGDGKEMISVRLNRGRRGRPAYEGVGSTVAILMVACWTLRIPVLCRDFIRLIDRYKLPYLDPVARGVFPERMVIHLSKHNMQALTPYHAPHTHMLYSLASRLAKLMYRLYGIFTPATNAGPVFWRVVSQGLGGTPVLYQMAKRVAQKLQLPLTLHRSLAPKAKNVTSYDPERRMYDNEAPEVVLMGATIIVLKMVYGLDGRPRVPQDANDAACGLPEVEQYLARLKRIDVEEEKRDGRGLFDGRRQDVRMEELDDDEVDAYLGFGKRALVGEAKANGSGDGVLDRYFPLAEEEEGSDAELKTHDACGLRGVIADGGPGVMRPGGGYRMYRVGDGLGRVSGQYGEIVDRAARWVGVSGEYLGSVVGVLERSIQIGKVTP